MRTHTLCHKIEKKINQKFVWLKVASINISRSTVSDCAPFLVVPFLFDIEQNSYPEMDGTLLINIHHI